MTIVFIIVGIVILAIIGYSIFTYNTFIKLFNYVEESWKQIDVQLQRRHDLIPNLVATVQGYTTHEQNVFQAVTEARMTALHVSGPEKIGQVEEQLTKSLHNLVAVAENYPALKASHNFLQLQHELGDTEDRIAASRRIYNSNVREYNTKQQTLPSNMIANRMHLTTAEYFQADATANTVPALKNII